VVASDSWYLNLTCFHMLNRDAFVDVFVQNVGSYESDIKSGNRRD